MPEKGYAEYDDPTTVTVLTSFPAAFFEPYQEAFAARHPEYRLRILNKKTTTALFHILERPNDPVDVFWASASDAFEVLKANGRLAPVTPPRKDIPQVVRNHPLNDPDGRYVGFALSGYGILWNEDYLAERRLPLPQGWEDLKRPAYRGHLGISAPSRSGTTHLMVETVLQVQGWEKGWATWNEIGGNLATVTARSYGVADGVARKRFGIGITIDFLSRSQGPEAERLAFVYPRDNVFIPANVAIVEEAPNRPGAEAFIAFLLSDEGQAMLARPEIMRLPVLPQLYVQDDPSFPNPYRITERDMDDRFMFDAKLSGLRYELVNILFDELITFRLDDLKRIWGLIHRGEAILRDYPDETARDLLRQARATIIEVPVTAADSSDADFNAGLRRMPRGVPTGERQRQLEEEWRLFIRDRHEKALDLASRAMERLAELAAERLP
ncbi:ABC transporter substrate-binding protein [Telmatospirillum sp. J64-1]|uniref:ABC transporter substrate-binding protein n=1 Tax=Telmatospirillum sp. J64-1 TaxID=2502183 RepID=UPI00210593A2|nr:extracellular solute-binding protein [Telmatospirillum sp. J64-1]